MQLRLIAQLYMKSTRLLGIQAGHTTLRRLAIFVAASLDVAQVCIRQIRLHLQLLLDLLTSSMTKSEYKKELMTYIEKQIDKLTVKQLRTLIASYARG